MRRILTVFLVGASALFAQNPADEEIASGLTGLLEILAPPEEGQTLEPSEAEGRAERFQAGLEEFLSRWEPRAEDLDRGRFVLARALVLAGRPADAPPHFRAFLEAHPGHADAPDAHVGLGAALLDADRPAEAAVALEAGLAAEGTEERRTALTYYLGLARLETGEREAALGHFDTVWASGEESPLVADAALKKLEALRDAGRIEEARAWHATLVDAVAEEAPWLVAVGEELERLGTEAPALVDAQAWLLGGPLRLEELKGRVVVLNFFADRYPACKIALERLAEVDEDMGEEVVFIGLTRWYRPTDAVPISEQKEDLREYLGSAGVEFPVLVAEGFDNLRNYGVRGIPHTVVIDPSGRIAWIDVGASEREPRAKARLREAIRRAGS